MIDTTAKQKIIVALKEQQAIQMISDRAWATKLGINPAQWSMISAGNYFKVLADGKWITLARIAEVDLKGNKKWTTAQTRTFKYISDQLKKCQEKSISAIFCDEAGMGKTYAARVYARENKNAVYIDCSLVKSKQKLVRQIAKEFGVGYTGRYSTVFGDLAYYITSAAQHPLVILDEAGDLEQSAFLELKALWNATEEACGWYMMGADGLKAKIDRAIDYKRVGYTEIFSRYGRKYQRLSPLGREAREEFVMQQAAQIIKANAPEGADIDKILLKVCPPATQVGEHTEGSLRRIPTELKKLA